MPLMRLRLAYIAATLALFGIGLAVAMAGPGTAIQVSDNASTGDEYIPRGPATAVVRSGRQLVVWTQDDQLNRDSVWGRIVDTDGAAIGEPFQISASGTARTPAVAARGRRDEFLVTWTDAPATSFRIVARQIDRDGNLRGQEFVMAETGQYPALVYGGRRSEFMVVWHDFNQGAARVYGARLPAGSSETPAPFRISSGDSEGALADVAYDKRTGRYLVGWGGGFVRLLPAEPGGRRGPVRRVSETGGGPELAYNASEREYVALLAAGDRSVVRQIRPDGTAYGEQRRLPRSPFRRIFPWDLASIEDGGYMVVFDGETNPEEPNPSVYARRIGRDLKIHRLRSVSSEEPGVSGTMGVLAYSRAQERARVVWLQGQEDQRNPPPGPRPPWEVFTRGL